MVKPRRFDKAWMEALERGVGPCLRAYVRRQMGMTMRCFGLARTARALRPGALLRPPPPWTLGSANAASPRGDDRDKPVQMQSW